MDALAAHAARQNNERWRVSEVGRVKSNSFFQSLGKLEAILGVPAGLEYLACPFFFPFPFSLFPFPFYAKTSAPPSNR